MSVLRTRCQQRVDKEVDGQIASPLEWNTIISEVYGDLWTAVVGTGMRYFERSQQFIATGAKSYPEPVDHYETVNVAYIYDTTNGYRRDLDELMEQERSRYMGLTTSEAYKYALIDDQLYLFPNPPSGTYEMLYVAQPPDLSAYTDTQLVDVVAPAGEEFLIWGAAVRANAKSESDVTLALQERDGARAKLVEEAVLRALNAPRRRVVRDAYDDSPYGGIYDPADWWNRR
jgi:hypothetical protein